MAGNTHKAILPVGDTSPFGSLADGATSYVCASDAQQASLADTPPKEAPTSTIDG